MNRGVNDNNRIEVTAKIFSIISSIAVIIGIFIALIQLQQAKDQYIQTDRLKRQDDSTMKEVEKKKYAIEAVNKAYTQEFIHSYSILEGCEESRIKISTKEQIDAFNYVYNTYYIIAIYYNNGVSDANIIKESIKSGINRFVDFKSYRSIDSGVVKYEIQKLTNSINK